MRPLAVAGSGKTVRLHRLTGDRGTQTHLASLGLVPGAELQLVSKNGGGPLIIALGNGRLVLGPEMARHIWVV